MDNVSASNTYSLMFFIKINVKILQLFRTLSIRIILTRSITFTSGNRFQVVPDSEILLGNFTDYVRSSVYPDIDYDSIMLITYVFNDKVSSFQGLLLQYVNNKVSSFQGLLLLLHL